MNFEQNPKIEELLNGYIDGELSADERSQVERLVSEDPAIAQRLHQLEKCKVLVSSLPPAEPPAAVVAGIKELIRSHSAGSHKSKHIERQRGARHLFIRQALAASIIIGLVGIMGAVVYKIVGPEQTPAPIVVMKPAPTIKPTAMPVAAKPQETEKEVVVAAAEDTTSVGLYSLQLQTADFAAVDAFVTKLLEESPWLRYEATKDQPGKSEYKILCSRGGLEAMMDDLATVWSKFDSTTLIVHTDNLGQYVTVASVKPEQIADIARQNTIDKRVKLAKDFAVLNSVSQIMPEEKMLALTDRSLSDLTTIPKPVLTSDDKSAVTAPKGAWDKIQVNLNIVVAGSNSLTTGGHK
jgi:anti-sigma-K factor RskA